MTDDLSPARASERQNYMDLQQAIDQAQKAYQELDQALNEHDWRKIGAAMYQLKRALDAIQEAAKPKKRKAK